MTKASLVDWSVNYIKNKDILKKELLDLKVEEKKILLEYKNRKSACIVSEDLSTGLLENNDIETIIVCLNTKENFNSLITGWGDFSKHKNLTLVFANPDANEKWIIKPYVHSMISEEASLKTGLKSMFETVPLAE